MKHYTSKRAKLEREYRKALQEILEERPNYCEGCWRPKPRTPSHRISRRRNILLLADKDNIDLYCHDCHELVELGRYEELRNGEQVKEYIKNKDYEYFLIKTVLKCKETQT